MEAEKASKKGARAEKDGDVEEMDRITDLITNSEKKKKFLLSMVPVNHKPLGSMRYVFENKLRKIKKKKFFTFNLL